MNDIQTYFDNNCFELDREAIYKLNEQDNGPINNVISLLSEHCYGVMIYDDKEYLEYSLFYIDNKVGLSGSLLQLSMELDSNTRNHYSVEFCKIINDKYPHADIIDTFNSFQSQLRGQFEKMGYFTIGNEIEMFKGKNAVGIFRPSKGIASFPMIDKKNLYRWFFGENEEDPIIDSSKTKKIYLILDSSNNLIKNWSEFLSKSERENSSRCIT